MEANWSRFAGSNPSPAWKRAIKALEALAAAEGHEQVQTAAAEVIWKHRRAAWLRGKAIFAPRVESEEVSHGAVTPWRLVRRAAPKGPYGYYGLEGSWTMDLPWDHAELIRAKSGGYPTHWTAQPYGVGWGELQRAVRVCQQWGLRMDISAEPSWHYPGHTVLVVVTHDKDKQQGRTA